MTDPYFVADEWRERAERAEARAAELEAALNDLGEWASEQIAWCHEHYRPAMAELRKGLAWALDFVADGGPDPNAKCRELRELVRR